MANTVDSCSRVCERGEVSLGPAETPAATKAHPPEDDAEGGVALESSSEDSVDLSDSPVDHDFVRDLHGFSNVQDAADLDRNIDDPTLMSGARYDTHEEAATAARLLDDEFVAREIAQIDSVHQHNDENGFDEDDLNLAITLSLEDAGDQPEHNTGPPHSANHDVCGHPKGDLRANQMGEEPWRPGCLACLQIQRAFDYNQARGDVQATAKEIADAELHLHQLTTRLAAQTAFQREVMDDLDDVNEAWTAIMALSREYDRQFKTLPEEQCGIRRNLFEEEHGQTAWYHDFSTFRDLARTTRVVAALPAEDAAPPMPHYPPEELSPETSNDVSSHQSMTPSDTTPPTPQQLSVFRPPQPFVPPMDPNATVIDFETGLEYSPKVEELTSRYPRGMDLFKRWGGSAAPADLYDPLAFTALRGNITVLAERQDPEPLRLEAGESPESPPPPFKHE